MRYEHVVQSSCTQCGCPLRELATFCLSDVAHLSCRKCGAKDTISSKQVHTLFEMPYFSGGFNRVWKHVPNENWKPTDLDSALDGPYTLVKIEGKEDIAFRQLMQEHGYTSVAPPQIGFLGDEQVVFPPVEI